MHYGLSLLYLLQALLKRKDMRDDIDADHHTDGVLRDILDAAYAKKMSTSNNELLLAFYHDELEVANPLGSRRGKHKLGIYAFTGPS